MLIYDRWANTQIGPWTYPVRDFTGNTLSIKSRHGPRRISTGDHGASRACPYGACSISGARPVKSCDRPRTGFDRALWACQVKSRMGPARAAIWGGGSEENHLDFPFPRNVELFEWSLNLGWSKFKAPNQPECTKWAKTSVPYRKGAKKLQMALLLMLINYYIVACQPFLLRQGELGTSQSYYNLRKDTCRQSQTRRQSRTFFPFTNYSAGPRPIVTKFGTDNLSESERELMVSEF